MISLTDALGAGAVDGAAALECVGLGFFDVLLSNRERLRVCDMLGKREWLPECDKDALLLDDRDAVGLALDEGDGVTLGLTVCDVVPLLDAEFDTLAERVLEELRVPVRDGVCEKDAGAEGVADCDGDGTTTSTALQACWGSGMRVEPSTRRRSPRAPRAANKK